MTYFYAVLTAFFLAFGFGPVFFSILQAGVEKGHRAGVLIASGTCSSDLGLAFTAYLGMFSVEMKGEWGFWLKIVGSVVLIGLGMSQFYGFRQTREKKVKGGLSGLQLYLKGVVLNVFNPLNFVTWTAIVLGVKSYKLSPKEEIFHLLLIIACIFTFEFFLAYYANKLSHFFEGKNLKRMKIFIALIMFGAAIKLLTSL